MNKSNLILVVVVIAAAGFFAGAWAWSNNRTTPTSSALESKTSADGWVEIEITPLALGSKEWSFSIILNAHQEIDADLMKAATLADNRGNALTPLRWEEEELTPGGHHREGALVFSAPVPKPQNITLALKDVGGAAVRTFSWRLP